MNDDPALKLPVSGKSPGRSMRLVVYAGPTGGHVFPAQSFSEAFLKRFPDSRIDLVTCRRAKGLVDRMPRGTFGTVTYLPEFGFPTGFSWKTVKPFILAPYLFFRSFVFLSRVKPDLCVGFGSFASYPGMMTAHWMKISTLIHEQNKVPGKATHWLLPHMDAVAESFKGTLFIQTPKELHTVGLPLRSNMSVPSESKRGEVVGRPFTVLVVGGSQGAQGLNALVVDAIAALTDEERSKIAVIHITGDRDRAWVSERYKKLDFPGEVHVFCGAMDKLFRKADLAITRAGANTLFELAAFGVPALVIPYPHAGGHQRFNAESFAQCGGLLFHDEDAEAAEWLTGHLRGSIRDAGHLKELGITIKTLARPGAADELVEIAKKMIGKHEDRK